MPKGRNTAGNTAPWFPYMLTPSIDNERYQSLDFFSCNFHPHKHLKRISGICIFYKDLMQRSIICVLKINSDLL